MVTITALIHTGANHSTIAAALSSVRWADHVLVAAMPSTDGTAALAESRGATVLPMPQANFVEAVRQLALDQVTDDWVFILDADEECSPTLAQKLRAVAAANSVDAVQVPRSNIIFGQKLAHAGWWPDYQLRFFRPKLVAWPTTIHGQPLAPERTLQLEPLESLAIVHHNYQTVTQFLDRLNRYTSITVDQTADSSAEDVSSSGTLLDVLVRESCSRLFLHQAWQDGERGLTAALLQSVYELVVAAKTAERQSWQHSAITHNQWLASVDHWSSWLAYWRAQEHLSTAHGLSKFWWRVRQKWQF